MVSMKMRGLQQRFVGAGVEPGMAAAHDRHVELARVEIVPVDVGDLQLAARRGLQVAGDVDHLVVVEIEAGDRVVRLRLRRAFPRG